MKLTYWASACVTIETDDCRILCDPWFGFGNNWDGSWTTYPPVAHLDDAVEAVGRVDLIYLSHLHDDHYCPAFLRAYLQRSPTTRLLISSEPHLVAALSRDGFTADVGTAGRLRQTEWFLERSFPLGCLQPIDSALAVRCGDEAVIHLNDCPWDARQVGALHAFVHSPAPRKLLACLPYLGAGEYPQTYAFPTPEASVEAGQAKRLHFLDQFVAYVEALQPTAVLPFAGEYWLRGPLATLNAMRELPDALEAVALAQRLGVEAAALDFGGMWNLTTGERLWERTTPLDRAKVQGWIEGLPAEPYRYAREIQVDPARISRLIPPLVRAAARRYGATRPPGPTPPSYWYILGALGATDWWGAVNLADGDYRHPAAWTLSPREEVRLDPRHAYGLLTGLFSWNVALVGSHLQCRRVPDVYQAWVYEAINGLRV